MGARSPHLLGFLDYFLHRLQQADRFAKRRTGDRLPYVEAQVLAVEQKPKPIPCVNVGGAQRQLLAELSAVLPVPIVHNAAPSALRAILLAQPVEFAGDCLRIRIELIRSDRGEFVQLIEAGWPGDDFEPFAAGFENQHRTSGVTARDQGQLFRSPIKTWRKLATFTRRSIAATILAGLPAELNAIFGPLPGRISKCAP